MSARSSCSRRHDAAALEGERIEETELGRRQLPALAPDVGLHVQRVDEELLDLRRAPRFSSAASSSMISTFGIDEIKGAAGGSSVNFL